MDKFIVGFLVAVVIVLIGLLLIILGNEAEGLNIAKQCKSYSMATIDDKVYNCTLKEVK